jgi:hypothetical protein
MLAQAVGTVFSLEIDVLTNCSIISHGRLINQKTNVATSFNF